MNPTRRARWTIASLAWSSALLAGGCLSSGAPQGESAPEPDHVQAAVADRCRVLGYSRQGRPIHAREIGDGEELVLFLGAIHGDEPAGAPLLERLGEELARQPELLHARTALLVPIANPDGFAARLRNNSAHVDLNRNFPASNRSAGSTHGGRALSEPETRALHDLLESRRPARIITIHQPLACIDFDGPAEDLANRMASGGTLPVRRLGSRPGSLGSYAGVDLGVPIITLELPRFSERRAGEELWDLYGPMLLAALQ